MLNEFNPIDDLFRKGLNNVEEYPEEFVWEKLKSDLLSDKKKYNDKIWLGIAASFALLLAFFSGILISDIQKPMYIFVFPDTGNDVPDAQLKYNTAFPSGRTPLFMSLDKKNTSKNSAKLLNKVIALPNKEAISELDKNLITQYRDNENKKEVIIEKENSEQEKNPDKHDEILITEKHIVMQQEELLPEDSLLYQEDLLKAPMQYDKTDRKWSVGLDAGPLYAYRTIRSSQDNTISNRYSHDNRKEQKASFNAGEKALIAYSGGCKLSLSLNSNWSIQSGIYYNKIGQVIDNVALTRQIVSALDANEEDYIIHTSAGNLTTKNEEWNDMDGNKELNIATYEEVIYTEKDIHQTYSYLELPVLLRYTLLKSRIHFDLITGLSSAFLISNHSYLKENKTYRNIGETEALRSHVYNGIAGIGLSSGIAEGLRFNIEPTFRFSLHPVNSEGDIKNYPFSLALYTGLIYSF